MGGREQRRENVEEAVCVWKGRKVEGGRKEREWVDTYVQHVQRESRPHLARTTTLRTNSGGSFEEHNIRDLIPSVRVLDEGRNTCACVDDRLDDMVRTVLVEVAVERGAARPAVEPEHHRI